MRNVAISSLRVIGTLALALCVAGCSSAGLSDGRVELLTGVDPNICYAGGEGGETGSLVVDPKHGTSFNGHPVAWPNGFTARRAGSEVEVLDAAGTVVATTGRVYHISVAPPGPGAEPDGAYPAAVHCGYPWDFVDCATADADHSASASYCKD